MLAAAAQAQAQDRPALDAVVVITGAVELTRKNSQVVIAGAAE